MTEREQEVFLPEKVDEQINECLMPSASSYLPLDRSALEAVQALQRHFAPTEQGAALQRVWQRFEQKRAGEHRTLPARPVIRQQRRYRMKQVASQPIHSGSLTRRLTMAASVIFALLLVGSALLLFRQAPGAQNNTAASERPREEIMFAQVDKTLYRLDRKTLQPLWHFTLPSVDVGGQLVNDTYYITMYENPLENVKGDQTTLYALDAASGKVRWTRSIHPLVAHPVFSDHLVYIPTLQNGFLTVEALDSSNGTLRWAHHLAKSFGPSDALPLLEMGLIVGSDKVVYGELPTSRTGPSQLFALNAQNGNPLWQKDVGLSNFYPEGVLVDGVLYLTNPAQGMTPSAQSSVVAYNAANGEQIWSKPLDGMVSWQTNVLNGLIYVDTVRLLQQQSNGSDQVDCTYYALSMKDGRTIWQYQVPHVSVCGNLIVTQKSVYVHSYDQQTLVALDPANGRVRWTYHDQDMTIAYPPVEDNDQIYLSLPGNVIQILRVSDGKPIASLTVNVPHNQDNRIRLQLLG